ncbi:MAG: enoyl-CoA hydratase/isomerase family protein [Burkholderiaceae bacterium]
MPELVQRFDCDGVATLTLNRPDKLNALNVALFIELNDHIVTLQVQTESIGCVVLKGAGKCFSAGHDLKDIGAGEQLPRENFQAHVIDALSGLPQTVISAVHGHCYTGALELALAADIIVASDDVRFADTHARWALTPRWGGSVRLPARIGRAAAIEMMHTCRTVGAQEALRMGLCNRIFEADGFAPSVQNYAAAILENSWYSLRGIKKLLADTDGMRRDEALAHELVHGPGRAPDYQDFVARFTEKNKKGKRTG